jgi:hypothetical protein
MAILVIHGYIAILDTLFYGYMVILSMGDMLWSMACMVLWPMG